MSNREIAVKFTLDDKKLLSQLRQNMKTAEGITTSGTKKMGKSWSDYKTHIIAATAAIAAVGLAVKSILEANSQMEKLNTTFNVLYKDVDLAAAKMNEAMQFAAKTPYLLTDVVQAYGQLKVVGYDTIDWLRSVGDMAAVANRPLSEAASTMMRMASGSFGDAFMKLREQFFITREMLEGKGLKFDKAGSFKGSIEEAMAGVKAVVDENFGGMMDKQSQTMSGMVSNLEDWVFQIKVIVGEGLFSALKTDLQSFLSTLEEMNESGELQLLAENIGDVAKSIYNIGGAFNMVASAPGKLSSGLKATIGGMAEGILDYFHEQIGGRDDLLWDNLLEEPLRQLAEWGTRETDVRNERLEKIRAEKKAQQDIYDAKLKEYELGKDLLIQAELMAKSAEAMARKEAMNASIAGAYANISPLGSPVPLAKDTSYAGKSELAMPFDVDPMMTAALQLKNTMTDVFDTIGGAIDRYSYKLGESAQNQYDALSYMTK